MSSQSKTGFFHFVKKEGIIHTPDTDIPEVMISPTSYYREVAMKTTHVAIDFATWVRAVSEPHKQQCGHTFKTMGESLQKLLHRPRMRTVFVVMDKDQVPIAKAATQKQRRDSSVALSQSAKKGKVERNMSSVVREAARMMLLPASVRDCIPEGMSIEEATKQGHITHEVYNKVTKNEIKRQESLAKHEEAIEREAQAAIDTLERTTLLDCDLPQNAFRHSEVELRTHKLNLLEKALVAVRRTVLPQPWNKCVSLYRDAVMRYICRTWVTSVDAYLCPRRGVELIFDGHRMSPDHFAVSGEEALRNPTSDYTKENTPLRFTHPSCKPVNTVEYGKNAEQVMVDNEFFLEIDPLEASGYLEQRPPYPSVTYAPEYYNEIGEADYSMYTHLRTALMNDPGGSHVLEVIARDSDALVMGVTFLYKWQHDLFQQKTSHLPLPNIVFTMGQGWASAGTKSGAIRMTAVYLRMIKYHFGGNAHCILDLVAALATSKTDYTHGYYYVPMEYFFGAYLEYHTVDHERHHSRRDGAYLQRLMNITSPVRDDQGNIIESGSCMLDGTRYRRLVNCAYFDKYKSRFTKLGYLSPMQLSLTTSRAIVNEATNKKYRLYVDDPKCNPPFQDAFDAMLEAFKKRLPPDDEIAKRALLVQYVMLLIVQVGDQNLREPEYSAYGMLPADPSRPISRSNFKRTTSDDYENREYYFDKVHSTSAMSCE